MIAAVADDQVGTPIPQRISGEAIPGQIVAMLRQDPDRDQWLRRLRESGATYLVVMKRDPAAPAETGKSE